jgi:hypothetical protein
MREIYIICLAAILSATGAPTAGAQSVKPEIASCVELKEKAIRPLVSACSAHIGCTFILNVQKSCADAQKFLTNLSAKAVNPRRLTNNDVFEAAASPPVGDHPALKAEIEKARAYVLAGMASPNILKRMATDKTRPPKYYEGASVGNRWSGGGVLIGSEGWMYRGQFANDALQGAVHNHYADGEVYAGQWVRGIGRQGRGVLQRPNGRVHEGVFSNDRMDGPALITYPDGSTQKVIYSSGTAIKAGPIAPKGEPAIDPLEIERQQQIKSQQEAAARAKAAAEAAAAKAAAAAAEKQRLEREFQASILTMTDGQLFAKADELDQAGQADWARQTRRALISRFPKSPLAQTAAQQLSGMAPSQPMQAPPSQIAGTQKPATQSGVSGQFGCAATPQASFQNFDKEFGAFMQRRPNRSNIGGSRDQFQYSYFFGTEGLKILERYRACMSPADFATNSTALTNARNQGKTGCEQLATSPASCTPTYPGSWGGP